MKTMRLIAVMMFAACMMTGCKDNKPAPDTGQQGMTKDAGYNDNDTTTYGICGEGTAMHTLELKGDDGNIHTYIINLDDSTSMVLGGLLNGDRLAVISDVIWGDSIATKVINLTTLLGKWTSIDKNFEIKEGGVIQSNMEAESNPWTTWKIFNGQLVLNKDTFDIMELGADSLFIENKNGIFGYKRQK